MVIHIPSESEASDATVISGCLIDEEVETHSAKAPQLKKPQEIDPMAKTRKPQAIPTLGSRPVPNPIQGIPDIAGEPSAPPKPRKKKRKALAAPDERGKAHAAEQSNAGGDEASQPQT